MNTPNEEAVVDYLQQLKSFSEKKMGETKIKDCIFIDKRMFPQFKEKPVIVELTLTERFQQEGLI